MGKTIFTIFFFTAACAVGSAQVKIGINPVTVNPAAVLELSNDTTAAPSSWKSFIPAYVNFSKPVFTASTVWGISGTPTQGAIVFNTADTYSNGFSGPGLYYWLHDSWTAFALQAADNIRFSLTSSRAAYDNATAGSWIKVTAAEYNNLSAMVNGAAMYGMYEGIMNSFKPDNGWLANNTIGGDAVFLSTIPPSSYIIAWSVVTGTSPTSSTGSKLKVSGSSYTGYTDVGSPLSDFGSLSALTRYYFVLKKPSVPTPAVSAYIGVYNAQANFLGRGQFGIECAYAPGDSPNLVSIANNTVSFVQVIAVPTKQW